MSIYEIRQLPALAGSASEPSIAFLDDPNTGIYRPGADQVAISTGGTGRLFVDASGNVGVGTGTPNIAGFNRVDIGVAGVSGGLLTLRSSGGAQEANISCSATGLAFTTNSYATPFDARASEIIFGTGSSGLERLRITDAGNVGIGTSSPEARLNVVVPADGYTSLANTFGVSGPNSTGLYVGTHYDGSGAGCDLVARGYSAALGDFRFVSINGSYASPAERLRITSTGNVGIGVSAPDSVLHVLSPTGVAAFRVGYNGTSVNYYDADTQIFRRSSAAESLRIDSSGRLLVGTSSARSNFFNATVTTSLQVEGSGSGGVVGHGSISVVNNNGTSISDSPYLILGRSYGSSNGQSTLVAADASVGRVVFQGADGNELVTAAVIDAFVDGTPGANDMPGRLVFSTTADGAASPTERMRIKSTGTINFSNVAVYADNAAATTGGLAVGDVYRTSTGQLMIRY